MMLFNNIFHFLRPWWLTAMIPTLLWLWHWYRIRQQGNVWRHHCDPIFLKRFAIQHNHFDWPFLLISLLLCLMVITLAGPAWSHRQQPVYQHTHARVIILDLSESMLATDILPNRATRAIYKIVDLLKQYPEGKTALIAFTQEPFVVSPLTDDVATIATLLPELHPNMMPINGSNIKSALQKAAELFVNENQTRGDILLITANPAKRIDIAMAAQLARRHIHTSVLCVATSQGAPIPQLSGFVRDTNGEVLLSKAPIAELQQLTNAGHGTFTTFTDGDHDLQQLALILQGENTTPSKTVNQTLNVWQDNGAFIAILLVFLTLLFFSRGLLEEITT